MAAVKLLVKMYYSDSYLLVHRLKTVRENDTFEDSAQKDLKFQQQYTPQHGKSYFVHSTFCSLCFPYKSSGASCSSLFSFNIFPLASPMLSYMRHIILQCFMLVFAISTSCLVAFEILMI